MALREVLVKFGVDVDQNQARAAGKTADGLSAKFAKVAGAVGAGLVYDKVRDFTTAIIDMGDEIGDVSEQIGISAKELQRWRFLAESAGASTSELGVGLKILQKNAVGAVEGNKELVEAFTGIGVSAADLKANLNDPAKLFELVGLRLSNLPSQAERSAMAMKLFGKSGAALVPIFNRGEDGLRRLSEKFDELGGGLDQDALDALGDADQKLREFELTTRKVKGSLSVALLPTLTSFSDVLAKNVTDLDKAAKGTNLVEVAVATLATVAAAGAVAWAAPFAPFILTSAAAVASITDVFNAFDSGSSKMLKGLGWLDKKLTGNDLGDQANKEAKKFADDPWKFIQDDNNQQSKVGFESQLENLRQGFTTEVGGREKRSRIFDPNGPQIGAGVTPEVTFDQFDQINRAALDATRDRNRYLRRNRASRFADFIPRGIEGGTDEGANQIRAGAQAPGLSISALAGPFASAFAQASLDQQRMGLTTPLAAGLIAGPLPGAAAPIVNLTVQTTNNTNVSTTGGDPEEIAGATATAQAKSTAKALEATRNAIVPIIQRTP